MYLYLQIQILATKQSQEAINLRVEGHERVGERELGRA